MATASDGKGRRSYVGASPWAPTTSRREAIALMAGGALATLVPTRPVFADPVAGETSETSAEFNGPYTAWRGYASTARHSIAPGAVPVKAPVSGEVSWSVDVSGDVRDMALRQIGQATFLYAVQGSQIMRLDAKTGDVLGTADLSCAVLEGPGIMFSASTLVVVLEDGRMALFDEELNPSWTSSAPSLPSGATRWSGASEVVSAAGALYVALAAVDGSGAPVALTIVSVAEFDGTPLWQVERLAHSHAPALRLLSAPDALLLSDGGISLEARSLATGETVAALDLEGEVEGRIVALPRSLGEASGWVVVDVSSTASTVVLDHGGLSVASISSPLFGSIDAVPICAPVVVRDRILFMAAPSSSSAPARATARLLGMRIDASGRLSPLGGDLRAEGAGEGCGLLPVVYGDNAREAAVSLYAHSSDGGLVAVELSGWGDVLEGSASPVWSGESAAASGSVASTMLVDRDGSVILAVPSPESGGASRVVCLAPDEGRAAATPVGGSQGVDTLGSTLMGITLPNGVGLGAGAVLLAATFGAYALIRNRGGRSRRDEGVDAWRAAHGGDDELDGGSDGVR
ncbi:MAG: PQQ-binding-like beta-propeller repeat protein [Collinsella sp.]|nr:PQQ-binding-like beta-propeller repeat protein [Collinsella sp.]